MFQNFIVLGIVPGTNFQIDFRLWLQVSLLLLLVTLAFRFRRAIRYYAQFYWTALEIKMAVATHSLELK